MRRLFVLLVFIHLIYGIGYSNGIYGLDSLGVTQKGSDEYIIHQVDAGETLFALSRKYGVNIQQIRDANDASLSNLSVGQKVLIPLIKVNSNSTVHIVKSSETLFSISRNYNVKVDELKAWNNLTDNSISIGQKLIVKNENTKAESPQPSMTRETANRKTHIVKESQTLYSISRMYDVSTDQLKTWNNLNSNNLTIGQELIVSAESKTTPPVESHSSMLPPSEKRPENSRTETQKEATRVAEVPKTEIPAPSETNAELNKIQAPAEKVTERGIAEVIEDSEDTKKYLALHRSAPVGTIMQVRNEMNDQTVFVRVVGPIPPTGDNGKLLLKISKKAYDRLGAVDSRFPVEVSYIP